MYFAISDSMFARTCESLRWLAQMPAPFKRSSLNFERFIAAQGRLHEIASACWPSARHAVAEMLHLLQRRTHLPAGQMLCHCIERETRDVFTALPSGEGSACCCLSRNRGLLPWWLARRMQHKHSLSKSENTDQEVWLHQT